MGIPPRADADISKNVVFRLVNNEVSSERGFSTPELADEQERLKLTISCWKDDFTYV